MVCHLLLEQNWNNSGTFFTMILWPATWHARRGALGVGEVAGHGKKQKGLCSSLQKSPRQENFSAVIGITRLSSMIKRVIYLDATVHP